MQIMRDTKTQDIALRGAATAIGNFDGVHLGHQHVIGLARQQADKLGVPLGVMTFEPHPREFFNPGTPPFRLMNAQSRANRLAKLGVDILYEIPFSAELAKLGAQEFISDILQDGLGLSHIVVGSDFRFGQARAGSPDLLQQMAAAHGYGVTVAPLIAEGEERISSTAIRRALAEGEPRQAAAMLGHWHRIEGIVTHGHKRGRELGFPTANISLDGLAPPRFGVYAVQVKVLTGAHKGSYLGAASCGIRPMFGENAANFETYIFDFSGDLYGAQISVALVEFLRDEAVFDSLESFIDQMHADCRQAREILGDA